MLLIIGKIGFRCSKAKFQELIASKTAQTNNKLWNKNKYIVYRELTQNGTNFGYKKKSVENSDPPEDDDECDFYLISVKYFNY